jgi:hypothetical protein
MQEFLVRMWLGKELIQEFQVRKEQMQEFLVRM